MEDLAFARMYRLSETCHDHDVSCHVTTTFRNRRKFAIVYAQHSVLSADIETLNTVKCHEVITNEQREKNYYFYRLSFL